VYIHVQESNVYKKVHINLKNIPSFFCPAQPKEQEKKILYNLVNITKMLYIGMFLIKYYLIRLWRIESNTDMFY